MKSWETISYQTIKKVSFYNKELTVEFENGDIVSFEIKALLPFVSETELNDLSENSVTWSSYDIHFSLKEDKNISIPWDKIRVMTDKEFSRFIAEKAEEQAKLIGVKIKRLREKKGIRSNDLAERSGITAQTISRIEKGHTDVGFTTLKKLLASMGYSLKDLANEELELDSLSNQEITYNLLFRKLVRAGIDSTLLLKRIIPPNVHSALTSSKGQQSPLLLNEAASYVSTVYNWSIKDIWHKNDLTVPSNAGTEALYKMPANANINQIKAYAHYGHYLAKICLKAIVSQPELEFPGDVTEFKNAVFSEYGSLDFESVLRFAWDLGIIVLPLNDSGLFHGACWNIDDKYVIILKQNTSFHSRWLFDLLHELYHVFDHLQEANSALIETSEISPFANDESLQEREANSFANLVLFDGKSEEYAQECIQIADWNLSKLSAAVKKISTRQNIRADNLANYLAFRLSFQNQQWWAQATKLQIVEPKPYLIALNILKEKVSFNKLNPIESNLLKMAMNP